MSPQERCLGYLLGLLVVPLLAGTAHAKPQAYVDFPAQYMPASPATHPRLYINDRLPALKALYGAAPPNAAVAAFKHDIDKLLGYTSAEEDWRADSGWPAAALALDWLLTGNKASGDQACKVFLPYFTGASTHNEGSDLYYALAYDWLFDHPCMDSPTKAGLRARLVAWSDDTATADEQGSWVAHDSDANIAATAGHFIAGLAIVGEDPDNGAKLLRRGWTGWKYGLNAADGLPDMPVADLFRKNLDTGVPLPGWDYGMMSDIQKAQNLYQILDELGVIDAEFSDLKVWWPHALTFFMHSVDPANTHWRWIGDQQTDVRLDQGTGYIWSFLSNCVSLSERYGHTDEAALGRSFLDTLNHPSYGLSDGDTMLWFTASWPDSAPRIDFRAKAPRYVLGGLGPGQHMGMGMFRSEWMASPTDAKQVTWGGLYAVGSYIVDHMHNSAGSFWLWRNGEYLMTEPWNYGGNEAALYPFTLWNSLSIPNEAVPNENEGSDNGGPIVYFNQDSAYLELGTADDGDAIFYARVNGDKSYNVPDDQWASCTGACRQPVKRYTRSFYYDGKNEVIFLVDRADLARSRPAGLRFRTQNQGQLGDVIDDDTVSLPSDKGSYHTLIRVLSPTGADAWTAAAEPWLGVSEWQIDPSMVGSQVHKDFAAATMHRIVTVLLPGKADDSNAALDDAAPILASDSVGGCAPTSCFVVAAEHDVDRTTLTYTTPDKMVADARQVVADMDPTHCYQVKSSTSGAVASGLSASADGHVVQFHLPKAGAQAVTLSTTKDCTPSGPGVGPGSAKAPTPSAKGCACGLGEADGRAPAGVASLLLAGAAVARRARRRAARRDRSVR